MPHPNYLAVLQALAQLPGGTSPITPPFIPTPINPDVLALPESARFPMPEPPPPAPSRSAAEFLPEILARTRAAMGPETPYASPAQPQAGGLGGIIRALLGGVPQAIAVGLSENPGAALQQQLQQQTLLSERRRQEELDRQQRNEDRRYGEDQFIRRTALGEAQAKAEREEQRKQAEADRQFGLEVKKWERELGLKDDREKMMLQELIAAKRQREAERIADEKQKAAFEQQSKIAQAKRQSELLSVFKVTPAQAKRIAAFEMGEAELSPADEKVYTTIRESMRRTAGGGGGGGGTGKIMTWAELSDGSIVPSDKVKLDVLPPGVTVRRLFSTGIPGMDQAGGTLTAQMVDAALSKDTTPEQRDTTIQAMRAQARSAQERALVEERIKAAKPVQAKTRGATAAQAAQESQRQNVNKLYPALSPEEAEMLRASQRQ